MTESNGAGPVDHATIAEALLAAQIEMPAVRPDAENPHYGHRFVSLGHLIAKVRPVLNRHGIAFSQFPSSIEGQPTLVTLLVHRSGERIEYQAPLFLPKNDPQGQGSAITYMRRYALASALGISDQEDDDGEAGARAAHALPRSQAGAAEAQQQPPSDGGGQPQEAAQDPEQGIAELLAKKSKLREKRLEANEWMVKLGAGSAQRLRELENAGSEKALDALIARVNAAMDQDAGGETDGA